MIDTPITLKQAVPYLQLYQGRIFVVKVGGRILSRRETLDALAEDVATLHTLGIRVILVHGGGPQATELSRKLGFEPRIVAGRRVTDGHTLEVAKMIYAGSVHIDLLAALQRHGVSSIGVSGVDANLILAVRRPKTMVVPAPGETPVEVDFGSVGDIQEVNGALLRHLLDGGLLPVICSLGVDRDGNVLNINADSIAEAVARTIHADKLLIVTDTDGILRDVTDPATLVSYTDIEEIEAMKKSGALSGGMLPKVQACVAALSGGVRRTHVLNGMKPGALVSEIFTNAGCGTMIVDRRERETYQKAELGQP